MKLITSSATNPFNIHELVDDIKTTKSTLVIASAYFTDMTIAKAILNSKAKNKLCIVSSDKHTNSSPALKLLKKAKVKVKKVGTDSKFMHHKVLICGRKIRIGSYNYTYSARSNSEVMVVFSSVLIALNLYVYYSKMVGKSKAKSTLEYFSSFFRIFE